MRRVLKSLPEHISNALVVKVFTSTGALDVLSVYLSKDGEEVFVDVE